MLESGAFRFLNRAVVAAAAAALCHAELIDYPKTSKVEHVDVYHGIKVPDPYRWLEDENSPETAAWVAAQNNVTFSYLEKIPFRGALRKRLSELYDYPTSTALPSAAASCIS